MFCIYLYLFKGDHFEWYIVVRPDRFIGPPGPLYGETENHATPALICNGPKRVIQSFAEEETINFREIIKKGHFKIFPGALRHFRIGHTSTPLFAISSLFVPLNQRTCLIHLITIIPNFSLIWYSLIGQAPAYLTQAAKI